MESRIGVDESGKGDYFGYLVVAAVFVDNEEKLASLRVRDSKMLSDYQVKDLAPKIKKMCKYDIVKISPEKYNQLYKKFKSLNNMLAWAHAKAIDNLLKKTRPEKIVIDKFSSKNVLKDYLKTDLNVEQIIRGERDIAVAAASILARNEFLVTLRKLGRDVGFVLPKGSTHVEKTVKEIMKVDEKLLFYVAKLHFKITKKFKNI